jgi:hypothetical protein
VPGGSQRCRGADRLRGRQGQRTPGDRPALSAHRTRRGRGPAVVYRTDSRSTAVKDRWIVRGIRTNQIPVGESAGAVIACSGERQGRGLRRASPRQQKSPAVRERTPGAALALPHLRRVSDRVK